MKFSWFLPGHDIPDTRGQRKTLEAEIATLEQAKEAFAKLQ